MTWRIPEIEGAGMKLIYLKEGRHYTVDGLKTCVSTQLLGKDADPPEWLSDKFFSGLRGSINDEFDRAVVRGKKSGHA